MMHRRFALLFSAAAGSIPLVPGPACQVSTSRCLGSGGPGACRSRRHRATFVSIDGLPRILVDAGPGSFRPSG